MIQIFSPSSAHATAVAVFIQERCCAILLPMSGGLPRRHRATSSIRPWGTRRFFLAPKRFIPPSIHGLRPKAYRSMKLPDGARIRWRRLSTIKERKHCSNLLDIRTCSVVPTIMYSPKEVVDGDGTVLVPSALWSTTSTTKKYWVNLREYDTYF